MYNSVFHRKASFTEEGNRSGQQLPFRLLHHAALQRLGGVPLLDRHGLLEHNRAAVADIVYKVHRCARHFDAAAQRFLMDAQAVKPSPQKEGMSEGCTLRILFS